MEHEASLFRTLADNSPLFIGMCHMDYTPFYVNEAGCRLVGLDDLHHFTQTRVDEFFFPEDRKFILEEFLPRVLREGRAETEIRFRHFKSGDAIWMLYDVFFLRGENGEPVGLATLSRDITDRKTAEAAAAEVQKRTQSIIDNTPSIVYAFDLDERFLLANRAVAELLNATPQQLIGKRRDAFMPKEDADWHEANDRKVIEAGAGLEFEEYSELKGRSITWLTQKFPLRDTQGRVYGVGGISTDVSHHKALEETLRESESRKDEFIATLAHELRNPIASIKNAANVLADSNGKEHSDRRETRVIGIIKRQADHLVRLVDDLLEVTRITTGKITLRREVLDLNAIVREAIEGSAPFLNSTRHNFEVYLSEDELLVDVDRTRMTQAITNILNNAAKYTPPGGSIVLSTGTHGLEASVSVRDNGIGILPEMQSRIFDLFSQSPRAAGQEQGGIGVGLTISRKLVEMQGGHIEAHSEGAWRGSEFVIVLPLVKEKASATATKPLPTADVDRSSKRVLVIDDDHDVADSMAMLLEDLGLETRVVYSGEAALGAIDAFAPDVILLDLGMPKPDGFETARLIRKSQAGRQFKLVALTGWGQEQDRKKTRDAGFDLHLTKPASIEDLDALFGGI